MAENKKCPDTCPLVLNFSESGGWKRIYYSLECGEDNKVELLKPDSVNWVSITELTDPKYKYREDNKNFGAFLVEVSSQESGGRKRNTTLDFSINEGGNCGVKRIDIGQDGSDCGCGPDNFSEVSIEWPSNSVSPQDVTYEVGDCISVVTATTSDNHFTAKISSGKITVTPSAAGEEDIDGILSIQYTAKGATCDNVDIPLLHKGTNCGCGSFQMSDETIVWTASQTDRRTRAYSPSDGSSCVEVSTDVSVSNTAHFSARKVTNGIEVWPIAETTSEETGTVTVNFSANGVPCDTPKTFNVKHSGVGCSCAILEFKVDGESTTTAAWDDEASGRGDDDKNVKTITYTVEQGKEDCIDGTVPIDVEIIGSDSDKFGVDKTDVTSVKVWPIGKNRSTSNLNASIGYKYKLKDGTECDGSYDYVSLVQIGGCKCDDVMSDDCYQMTAPKTSGTYYIGYVNSKCGDVTFTPRGYGIDRIPRSYPGDNTIIFSATTKDRSAYTDDTINDITVTYTKKYNGKPVGECSNAYTLIQTDNWVTCDRWVGINITGEDNISYLSSSNALLAKSINEELIKAIIAFTNQEIISNASITAKNKPSGTVADWLSDFRIEAEYPSDATLRRFRLYASITENNTGSDREATITIEADRDKMRNLGICGCSTYFRRFDIKQKAKAGQNCDCQESANPRIPIGTTVDSPAGTTAFTVIHEYKESCFVENQPKFILTENADGTGVITNSDVQTYTVLSDYDWLSVKIEAVEYYSGSGKLSPKFYCKYEENNRLDPRDATFYLVVNLKDATEKCVGKVVFKQKGKLEITCETLNENINEYGSNNNIPYTGKTNEPVAFTSDEIMELLPEGVRLSGKTISSTPRWISNVDGESGNDKRVLADIAPNTTDDNDGATSARTGEIQVFFANEDGSYYIDNCTGKTITLKQNGYSGDCPSCDSISIDDLEIIYKDENDKYYGEAENGCSGVDQEKYPAFHGGTELLLFKCKINKANTVTHSGHVTRCFDVIAETTSSDLTYVHASVDSTDTTQQTFEIRGNLNTRMSGNQVSIPIALYIGKKDYANTNDGTATKCTTSKDGHIILLVQGKDCEY